MTMTSGRWRVEVLCRLLDSEKAHQVPRTFVGREAHLLQRSMNPSSHTVRRVLFADAAGAAEDFEHGQIRDVSSIREAVAFEIGDALAAKRLSELVEQPRFPDSRLAD